MACVFVNMLAIIDGPLDEIFFKPPDDKPIISKRHVISWLLSAFGFPHQI